MSGGGSDVTIPIIAKRAVGRGIPRQLWSLGKDWVDWKGRPLAGTGIGPVVVIGIVLWDRLGRLLRNIIAGDGTAEKLCLGGKLLSTFSESACEKRALGLLQPG